MKCIFILAVVLIPFSSHADESDDKLKFCYWTGKEIKCVPWLTVGNPPVGGGFIGGSGGGLTGGAGGNPPSSGGGGGGNNSIELPKWKLVELGEIPDEKDYSWIYRYKNRYELEMDGIEKYLEGINAGGATEIAPIDLNLK